MAYEPYMSGDKGPFRCDNCEHFIKNGNKCNQTDIIGFAKRKLYGLTLASDGMANVEPDACSNFYEPIGGKVPLSNYFGGGGEKVMANMKKTYGTKKAKKAFYATSNKKKGLDTAPSSRK